MKKKEISWSLRLLEPIPLKRVKLMNSSKNQTKKSSSQWICRSPVALGTWKNHPKITFLTTLPLSNPSDCPFPLGLFQFYILNLESVLIPINKSYQWETTSHKNMNYPNTSGPGPAITTVWISINATRTECWPKRGKWCWTADSLLKDKNKSTNSDKPIILDLLESIKSME